jgi:hypothetical protein
VRGDRTHVRTKPTTQGDTHHHYAEAGDTFHAYQKTTTGESVHGSKVWYGNRDGDRWVHSSVVR